MGGTAGEEREECISLESMCSNVIPRYNSSLPSSPSPSIIPSPSVKERDIDKPSIILTSSPLITPMSASPPGGFPVSHSGSPSDSTEPPPPEEGFINRYSMTISISLVPVACIAVVISARTKPMPCKYDCIISSMGSTSASDIAWATELALTPSKTLSKASSEAVGEVVCSTDVAAGVLSAMAAGIEAGTGVKVGAGVEAGGGDATPAAAGVMNTPGGSCC
mmetsp:Transcript_29838/g.28538  ORF Transcript_29838/g.28538 Transcript_29838/m.28538 type:complete len:221 (-) Transcript_29838:1324-1986(-)